MNSTVLAERIIEWLSNQSYGGEPLLHAIVCCDYVSRQRFVTAIAREIDAARGKGGKSAREVAREFGFEEPTREQQEHALEIETGIRLPESAREKGEE